MTRIIRCDEVEGVLIGVGPHRPFDGMWAGVEVGPGRILGLPVLLAEPKSHDDATRRQATLRILGGALTTRVKVRVEIELPGDPERKEDAGR